MVNIFDQILTKNNLHIMGKEITKIKRPFGITIISGLYIIFGIFQLVVISVLIDHSEEISWIDLILVQLIWLFFLLMGFGLSLGKKWGWWISTVLTMFSAMHGAYELINFDLLMTSSDLSDSELKKEMYKSAGKVLFQMLIVIYLFQKNVFNYFVFDQKNRIKKAIIVLIIAASLTVIDYLLYFKL